MDWYEIAFSLTDPYDYIEFAIKCRDLGVKQEFRPSGYHYIVSQIDGFVKQGHPVIEAYVMFKQENSNGTPEKATSSCCGGGKVL